MEEINKVFDAYEKNMCSQITARCNRVAGPDAGKYLQGQLTQDVLAMAEGESAWPFLLNPDGKANLAKNNQIGEHKYLLDMDSDWK